ncbi:MAG: acylneuraminate cytidylyltransferase family protein [Flavobacterium sp.]|nr:acylneuraminate cytidylyltransferase family protein [Flavobacterium sp.]
MIALIPARGGSKGLPGKNTKLLLGKPLIAYAIESALSSKFITDVYVSTDSKEIAEVAIKYGAKVPFLRPKNLATDVALAVDTYIFMLDKWKESGQDVDSFVVLQPTSPLRTSKNIDEAIELFQTKNASSVISYTEENHPVSWHKFVNTDLTFSPIFEEELLNRQQKRKTYYPNGAIFVFKASLIREKKYYNQASYAYLMSRQNSVDIDTLEDFEYAEFLLNKKRNDSISDKY